MRAKQAGIDLLNKAKEEHASRKRSADNEIQAVCMDGAKFVYSKPVSVNFGTFQFRRRPALKCCICGTVGGEFTIENGKAYCREDKQAIRMPEIELREYLTKRRKGTAC